MFVFVGSLFVVHFVTYLGRRTDRGRLRRQRDVWTDMQRTTMTTGGRTNGRTKEDDDDGRTTDGRIEDDRCICWYKIKCLAADKQYLFLFRKCNSGELAVQKELCRKGMYKKVPYR